MNNKCSKCGEILYPGDKFCTGCGSKVEDVNSRKKELMEKFFDGYMCKKCNAPINEDDKTCPYCGSSTDDRVMKMKKIEHEDQSIKFQNDFSLSNDMNSLSPKDFDAIYSLPEEEMIEKFLDKEIAKANMSPNMIPKDACRRKKITNIILSSLVFIYICLIFFHFPIYTYIIGAILLVIAFVVLSRFNLKKFIVKQVKSRPGEKISNIVMMDKNTLISDNSGTLLIISLLIAIILPLIIFYNPKIIYEEIEGGYAVRYYIFGLSNFKKVEIPEKYNGKDIVSLRGNTFSNMPFLYEVKLPDTIKEIRGQAFYNDASLEIVNMPENLEYLGGGAFYNCISLKSIEFNNNLTYLGGEAFYNAESLENVKLSNNIEEIRGDTFKYCKILRSIDIPDKVTRIGAHAFYGNINLSNVNISPNSKLTEIGSSAFRECDSLHEISLPSSAKYDARSFKDSPTTVKYYIGENAYVERRAMIYSTSGFADSFYPMNMASFSIKGTAINYGQDGYVWVDVDITGGIEKKLKIRCDGKTRYMISDNIYIIADLKTEIPTGYYSIYAKIYY